MALEYHYVLPGTGPLDAAAVREMFDDVKSYVDTLAPGGTVVTSLNAGTGINLSGTTGDITVTNSGVLSVAVSSVNMSVTPASTGAITVNFTSQPQFSAVEYSVGTGSLFLAPSLGTFTSWHLRMPANYGSAGYLLSTDGNEPANASWVAPTTVKAITGTTNQISVDNSGDPIVLSTPQDIATSSSPTFNQMLLSGGTSTADLTIKLHDSNNGFYATGTGTLYVVVGNGSGIQVGSWLSSDQSYNSVGPLVAEKHKFRGSSSGIITVQPQSSFSSYTLTLPADDGSLNQYLTTDGSGNLSWTNAAGTGTVDTGTANRLAYYPNSTAEVASLSAITASRAVVSDTNGLPTAATTTATEIGYVNGVTSAIQTQFTGKANVALSNLGTTAVNAKLTLGTLAVTSFAGTPTTGGSLATGTYYYKLYAFMVNDLVGVPSPEVIVVVSGSNHTVNFAWDAVVGATYYRLQRGTSQGSGDGYYETSSTSYSDTGASFTASGSAVTSPHNVWIQNPGTIDLVASQGAIRWFNYTDGAIGGSISCTSAGEMEFQTTAGQSGGNYFFNTPSGTNKIYFVTDVTTPYINFNSSDGQIRCGGTVGLTVLASSAGIQTNNGLAVSAGSLSVPGISGISDTNTGIRLGATADEIDFVAGGALDHLMTDGKLQGGAGDAASPAFSFINNSNTGMYGKAGNDLGFATNGVLRVNITTSGVVSTLPISITATSNHLVLSTSSNTLTISAAAQATSARTWTVPDISGNGTFAALEGTQTFSGTITFSSTAGTAIHGNSASPAAVTTGNVGEFVTASASASYVNYPTSTQFGDLTSITLGAGVWLISCWINHVTGGGTVTNQTFGISTTSGNSSSGLTDGVNQNHCVVNPVHTSTGSITMYNVLPSTSTTYYLKYAATYTGGPPQATGRISALRIG